MLMITIDTTAEIATLRFDGRLAAPDIHEVARNWTVMPFKPPHRRVLLDLTAVTAIDAAGREFLEQAHRDGNTLVSGDRTRVVVDEIVAMHRTDAHGMRWLRS